MKRKFLAKAITLGLMLAVPLGAQAKDAEGIIVNNVDNQTVTTDADLNIDINKPVDYYNNINGAHGAVVGLGIVDQSVDLSSLTITNTVTNDFGNDGADKNVHTVVTGVLNLADSVHVKNDVNIKLIGTDNRDKVNDNGTEKNAYVGVFGIITTSILTPDNVKPSITVDGNLTIDISGGSNGSSYLEGILLQDQDGTNLTVKGKTKISVTGKYLNDKVKGIDTANVAKRGEAPQLNFNETEIKLNGGSEQVAVGLNEPFEASFADLDVELKSAGSKVNALMLKNKSLKVNDLKIKVSDVEKIAENQITGIYLGNKDINANVKGNVDIDLEKGYAISTSNDGINSDFVLGADESKTVKIKGNVSCGVNGTGAIVINLNNSESAFTGHITGNNTLNLKKDSTWINIGASTVKNLNLNGANLVQGSADAAINKAPSGQFTIAGDNTIALNTTSDGSTISTGTNLFASDAFAANDVDNNTTIKLTSANQNASNISKENAAESFNNMLKSLGDNELQKKVTSAHLDGSYISGAIDAETSIVDDEISFTNVTQKSSTETIESIKKLPSINLVSWRTENNELSKRLGEVRDYDGEEGIWARMNHGESKYLDSFKTKAHLYQMGYDKKVGKWRLGGAVSYNKGTTTYENGSGKNRSTSLALYGAWLGDKGHYADIIVKEGKQKSEMTIGQTGLAASNLDYDMWATSISAEYGRKIALENNWFVEPQAELTYGRLGSADYGDNGFTVHQDSMDSLVGRMGFRLGKNLSDTSNVYLKASLLHEFCGDVDYTFTEGSTSKVSNTDLGDTWYEVGVGGSAQIGKATYAYAGLEKTFGGDFSTPWQWNAGVRWSF